MQELKKKYADRLEEMYHYRTAGDFSFSGVLAEFLEEIVQSDEAMRVLEQRHRNHRLSNPNNR
jgi:sulfite reductase alpha subunit-like flavoprotein